MEIKQEVQDMATVIGKGLTVDVKAATITAEDDVFEKTLPPDLSMDLVEKVRDHNTTFVAAGTLAFGREAIKVFAGNKSAENIETKISMGGKDSVTLSSPRTRETTDHLHGGGTIVKYAPVNVTHTTVAAKNAGQLKAVRNELAQDAVKRLSGK